MGESIRISGTGIQSPRIASLFAFLGLLTCVMAVVKTDDTESHYLDHRGPDWKIAFQVHLENSTRCQVRSVDDLMPKKIFTILERRAKLINYRLSVQNYTTNPLTEGNLWSYQTDRWSRIGSNHGATILSLAFNYGVLSLMTLNFGVEQLNVELMDTPHGCLKELNETEKLNLLLNLVIRDFDPKGALVDRDVEYGAVCHKLVRSVGGQAEIVHQCCHNKCRTCEEIVCDFAIPNSWLRALDTLLTVLMMLVFVFGPYVMPSWMYDVTLETLEYAVKLKEPLYKKVCVWRKEELPAHIEASHVLDLRNRKDFATCKKLIGALPAEKILPIKISQFDILVNYRKLLTENHVPVGVTECLSRAVFLCKLRDLEPFQECCKANILGCYGGGPENGQKPWINLCGLLGKLLLVVALPFPFYIRIVIYYIFEYPEITARHNAASTVGMPLLYNYRPLQYLTPVHPVFVASYIMYFITGFALAVLSLRQTATNFQKVMIGSFTDLKKLSMLKALSVVVKNLLWPFTKYGIFGCVIGLIYWPIFLPVSLLVWAVYSLPLVFLTCRILIYTFRYIDDDDEDQKTRKFHRSLKVFEVDRMLSTFSNKGKHSNTCAWLCSLGWHKILMSTAISIVNLVAIYAAMLMVSETIGFIAEVLCFTMMGMIVNASKVLKYGALIFLVIIYSYDTYNNVSKKYLKLNKSLFSEIKFRLGKDIDAFTSLPAELQGNRGFKAAEASDQKDYESIDDLADNLEYHWQINDMILFVDSEDTPRIPRKLFDEVCQITVPGSPGPIYKSLLEATGKFLVIIMFILFVFIVVMSFGEEYKLTSTNQMLATLAGGFIPLFLRRVLKPGKADIETSLVSFKSKLEEIIQNFCQSWLMYDFQFDIEEEPPSEEEDSDNESHKEKHKDKNGKGKDKDKKGKDHKDRSKSKANILDEVSARRPDYRRLMSDIRIKIDELELAPVETEHVDILMFVGEEEDWDLEWSSYSDLAFEMKENNNSKNSTSVRIKE